MRKQKIAVTVTAVLLAASTGIAAFANSPNAGNNGVQEWPSPIVKIDKTSASTRQQLRSIRNRDLHKSFVARQIRKKNNAPAPAISGINLAMAPPGALLQIAGQNFSTSASDNLVMFGNVPAQVVQATPTMLSVVVPQWPYGPAQLNIPVSVTVRGVRAPGTMRFDIGPKYLPSGSL